ncbi:hypothetical protein HGRIS_007624 [Hohenbuehelia grisea]|uniref:SAGA-associated factor 11 n=1 Tax=Hohenbuehelia grisea TaxID=104357 RepID=A0ABR3J5W2_9AGAR
MAVDGSADNGSSSSTIIKADGNITLDCMNCERQIAYSRYASHLSSCMGIQSSMRRGSVRGNGLKSKNSSETPRSTTPNSELGNISDDSRSLKSKAKSKSKREDDAEFNLKRKRLTSPQLSPTKKTKKKAIGSPVSRLKSEPDSVGIPMSSQPLSAPSSISRVPSKLRDSSTATFLERSPSTASSRSSSPGAPSVGTVATSSSFSGTARTESPIFSAKGLPKRKVTGTGPPKRPSPVRPPPPPVLDFTIDVEGEETGSSTDTDSS